MIFATVKKGERPRLNDKMLKMMSPEYFKLMRACWDNDPSKRPHFSKIKRLREIFERMQEHGNITIEAVYGTDIRVLVCSVNITTKGFK